MLVRALEPTRGLEKMRDAPRARRPAAALLRARAALPGARDHARARRASARRAAVRAPRAPRRAGDVVTGPRIGITRRGRAALALRPRRLALPQPAASRAATVRTSVACPGAAATPGTGPLRDHPPGSPPADLGSRASSFAASAARVVERQPDELRDHARASPSGRRASPCRRRRASLPRDLVDHDADALPGFAGL